ncbi:hypothetical protein HII31_10975 [Pseudocercospora fuligena]|uniref:Hydrophobin n=1 Tax=Pseudocercospora fuligena TaxID=685502 RepID=A0A8H6R809_9PEZI|nr:hypothetical protein HII31_10975 [Pseudocercospora fuligena]
MQFTSLAVALVAIASSAIAAPAPVQNEVEVSNLAPRAVNHVDQVNQINQVLQNAGVQITHQGNSVNYCIGGRCFPNYRNLVFDGCNTFGVLGYCGGGVRFDFPRIYNNFPRFLDYDFFPDSCSYPLYLSCDF